MNKDKLLKEILHNKELKEKYWNDIEVENINLNTLSRTADEENNDYLKYLYVMFNNLDSSKNRITQSLTNLF